MRKIGRGYREVEMRLEVLRWGKKGLRRGQMALEVFLGGVGGISVVN